MDYNLNNMPTNNEPQPKKNSGLVLVLLLIIIGLVAFIFVKRDVLFNSNKDVKEEQKQEEKQPEEQKEEEQVPEEEKLSKGTLDSSKELDKAEISINNKKFVLEYKFIDDEGPGINSLKLNDTKIYYEGALDGIGEIKYEVFVSALDNKQYLYVSYEFWGTYGVIIDDNGKIIKKVSEFAEEAECYLTTDEALEKESSLITVKDGYVYYFKYKGNDLDNKETVTLHEVRVSIKNSKVTDEETGKTTVGHPINCA